jgi:hypothetical protein
MRSPYIHIQTTSILTELISLHDPTATTDVTETGIAVAPALQVTAGGTDPQSFAEKARLIRTRQAGTTGNESVRTAILAAKGAMIGPGIEIGGHRGERPDGMMIVLLAGRGTHSKIGKGAAG